VIFPAHPVNSSTTGIQFHNGLRGAEKYGRKKNLLKFLYEVPWDLLTLKKVWVVWKRATGV